MEDKHAAIMDKLTKVCTCRQITRAAIKKAIAGGCDTVEAVNRATKAGSGACGGRNCGERIRLLLTERE